jgi:hypothetical protein
MTKTNGGKKRRTAKGNKGNLRGGPILNGVRVDRKRMSVATLADPANDVAYWRSRSPAERLAYMEYLRLINYGEAAVSGRLKRVFEVIERRPR